MKELEEEVSRAIQDAGVVARTASAREADELRRELELHYVERWPLWEYDSRAIAIQDPDAWRLLSSFLSNTEAFLLFNPDDDQSVFWFESGRDIVSVVGESYGFEFYVTDRAATFYLSFNHHDFLVASGGAVPWLKGIINSREESNE
jgi:hypothetical protein